MVGLESFGLAALRVGGARADDEDVVLVPFAAHRGLHVCLRDPRHGVVDVRHHVVRVLGALEDLVERDDVAVGGFGAGDGARGGPRDVQVVVRADHGDLDVVRVLGELLAHVHSRESAPHDHHPPLLSIVHLLRPSNVSTEAAHQAQRRHPVRAMYAATRTARASPAACHRRTQGEGGALTPHARP